MNEIPKNNQILDDFESSQNPLNSSSDELGTGYKILSFCIPIAGAIIYFNNKTEKPKKAASACTAALWGVGLSFLMSVLEKIASAN